MSINSESNNKKIWKSVGNFFKSIGKFLNRVDDCVLDRLANTREVDVDKFLTEIKEYIESESKFTEQGLEIQTRPVQGLPFAQKQPASTSKQSVAILEIGAAGYNLIPKKKQFKVQWDIRFDLLVLDPITLDTITLDPATLLPITLDPISSSNSVTPLAKYPVSDDLLHYLKELFFDKKFKRGRVSKYGKLKSINSIEFIETSLTKETIRSVTAKAAVSTRIRRYFDTSENVMAWLFRLPWRVLRYIINLFISQWFSIVFNGLLYGGYIVIIR